MGPHPLEIIWNELLAAWGDENEKRPIRWQLHFRIGRDEAGARFHPSCVLQSRLL
jgi:hypothetical protein